jgi:hypothetical protein
VLAADEPLCRPAKALRRRRGFALQATASRMGVAMPPALLCLKRPSQRKQAMGTLINPFTGGGMPWENPYEQPKQQGEELPKLEIPGADDEDEDEGEGGE